MTKLPREFVQAALKVADNGQSKLTERERELFGLSSDRLRSFINNLCTKNNTSYLEIGTYKGATLISAVFGNDCKAVGVENFSYDVREPAGKAPEGQRWENMRNHLLDNVRRYSDEALTASPKDITIIEQSFDTVNWEEQPKFDICFFDVNPVTEEDYEKFFELVLPSMKEESIVIFSNYSNSELSKILDKVIEANKDKFDLEWSEQRISGGLSDSTAYYSGILVMGVRNKVSKPLFNKTKTIPKIEIPTPKRTEQGK